MREKKENRRDRRGSAPISAVFVLFCLHLLLFLLAEDKDLTENVIEQYDEDAGRDLDGHRGEGKPGDEDEEDGLLNEEGGHAAEVEG